MFPVAQVLTLSNRLLRQFTKTPIVFWAIAALVAVAVRSGYVGSMGWLACGRGCDQSRYFLAGIYWARIGRIVYACTRKDAANIGFDDDHLYQQIPLAPEDRDIPMTQAMRHAGLVPFDEWREKLDRTPY